MVTQRTFLAEKIFQSMQKVAVLVNRAWLLYDDAIYEFWSFAWRLCQILWLQLHIWKNTYFISSSSWINWVMLWKWKKVLIKKSIDKTLQWCLFTFWFVKAPKSSSILRTFPNSLAWVFFPKVCKIWIPSSKEVLLILLLETSNLI